MTSKKVGRQACGWATPGGPMLKRLAVDVDRQSAWAMGAAD